MEGLLKQLLEPRIGHVLSPWPSQVYRTVEYLARMDGLEPEAFLQRLLAVPDEQKIGKLVAAATINHTAFFRHPEQFDYLRSNALPRMVQRSGIVRIWSAGCATGEEPYSLALSAQDARVPVHILATDVNAESLRIAQRGHYEPRRAGALPDCHPVHGWTAPDTLKHSIRFELASLTGPRPALGLGPFDIIFCRNVLVYFDQEAASQLIETLLSKLRPSGALVVAPVEGVMRVPRARPTDAPLGWFAAMAPPAPTVKLEGTASGPTPSSTDPAQPTRSPASPPSASPTQHRPARPVAPPAAKSEEPSSQPSAPLEEAAQRLGDGDRDGAEELLRRTLDANPTHAEAWFLLGETLLQRSERVQARIAFNRAATCAAQEHSPVEAETLVRAARRRAAMCG